MTESLQLVALEPLYGVANLQPFSWIVALGLLFSVFLGMAMGSNDVANAFATSVGAEVLTMRQAIAVAVVCTFTGAVTLGPGVTKTVAGEIVNLEVYQGKPEAYMLGMFCALLSAAMCVALATKYGLPVSTTHAIIGAIAGFSMIEAQDGVLWWPNMAQVVASWVVSPVLAGALAATLFTITKRYVLLAHRVVQLQHQRFLVAIILGATVGLGTVFVLSKTSATEPTIYKVLFDSLVPLAGGLIATLISYYYILPYVLVGLHPDPNGKPFLLPIMDVKLEALMVSKKTDEKSRKLDRTGDASAVHDEAEVYDPTVEDNFKVVQVLSASLVAFSQGANDIANSAGPFLAIWDTYNVGLPREDLDLQYWIVIVCAVGVVFGLATFGEQVIRTVGTRITRITASRGYVVELSTAGTVLFASAVGLPVSSTHCAIGAIVAVGLVNSNGCKAVQWGLIRKVIISWIMTLPLAAGVSILLYLSLRPLLQGLAPSAAEASHRLAQEGTLMFVVGGPMP